MIESIETFRYGLCFRSRLEARWAAFFTSLGLEWEYETKPFLFGRVGYLPDFPIPKLRCFIEIKPTSESDLAKPKLLAATGRKVIVLCGDCGTAESGQYGTYNVWSNCLTYGAFSCHRSALVGPDLLFHRSAKFGICTACGRLDICQAGSRRARCLCGGNVTVNARESSRLFQAYLAAARSDFDITPIGAVIDRVMERLQARLPA